MIGALLGALVSAQVALNTFDRQLHIDNMRLSLDEYSSIKSLRPNSIDPKVKGEYKKIISAQVSSLLINELSGEKAGESAKRVYWILDCIYRLRNGEKEAQNDCKRKLGVKYSYNELSTYYDKESDNLLDLITTHNN